MKAAAFPGWSQHTNCAICCHAKYSDAAPMMGADQKRFTVLPNQTTKAAIKTEAGRVV